MKDILKKIESKWFLLFLCVFCSVGAQAQWGEQWQDFEDMAFGEGTGNSYWVFDDNGNAYAANNSDQEFQYTVFTSEGQILDYSYVDPQDVGIFLSGLDEEQFNNFFDNSERVLSEVTVGYGNNFDDEQFITDVVQSYVEALDRYGLNSQPYYGSSGAYGWNDGSAEIFWNEYMPITSSFSKFYNGVITGDKSDIALGAGLLALDILTLGEGSAGVGAGEAALKATTTNVVRDLAVIKAVTQEVKLVERIAQSGMTNSQAGAFFGWGKGSPVKTVTDFTKAMLEQNGWTKEVLENVAEGYRTIGNADPLNPSALPRAEQLESLLNLFN